MKQIIPVKGMGCAKCKARVENALNAIAGVAQLLRYVFRADQNLRPAVRGKRGGKIGHHILVEGGEHFLRLVDIVVLRLASMRAL